MKTREDLLELDRDELLNEIRNASGLEIGDIPGNSDLSISTWSTADGYELHVVTFDERNLNWEDEVYYYEPSTEEILEKFKYLDSGVKVYCWDTDDYFTDEEAMINYLIDEFPENYCDEIEEDHEPTGGFSKLFK